MSHGNCSYIVVYSQVDHSWNRSTQGHNHMYLVLKKKIRGGEKN